MNVEIFHLIFALGFFSMFVLRIYYGRKARGNREGVEYKEGKANLALRAFFGFGYILTLIIYVFSPSFFEWAAITLPDWVRWIGALMTIISVLLLWWVQWALDVQFDGTLHTQAEHELVQHGPYKWVRHPMYTTFFLMGIGWSLLTANWFIGFPLSVAIVLVVFSRVKKEEAVLIELFGNEYRAYMQNTGRFLPKLVHN